MVPLPSCHRRRFLDSLCPGHFLSPCSKPPGGFSPDQLFFNVETAQLPLRLNFSRQPPEAALSPRIWKESLLVCWKPSYSSLLIWNPRDFSRRRQTGNLFFGEQRPAQAGPAHGPHTQKGTRLVETPLAILKFLAIPEQEAPYFHFAPGPTHYVIGPAHKCPTSGGFPVKRTILWLHPRLSSGHRRVSLLQLIIWASVSHGLCLSSVRVFTDPCEDPSHAGLWPKSPRR